MNGIHCALTGRLAATPELRFTNTGKPICALSLAVSSDHAGDTEQATTGGYGNYPLTVGNRTKYVPVSSDP